MPKVSIASPQELVKLDRPRLREIVRQVMAEEDIKDYEISLAFVDNPTIHGINKRFLEHDEPTDVITFPYSSGKVLVGELVIGVEVALEQARVGGHEVDAELALYVIHGLLHLVGYDDKDAHDRKQMRVRERYHLNGLGLPDIGP
ncbi:MAG: rRNA maturation RNase YbeY [Gemmataceae bacterium]|nr:rRNA maturation RNase YbeY [Planctomycetota bacterium]NBU74383.1 rRNA maturation RNase YbeY [Planctomycetota bacterium]